MGLGLLLIAAGIIAFVLRWVLLRVQRDHYQAMIAPHEPEPDTPEAALAEGELDVETYKGRHEPDQPTDNL